MSDDPAPHVLFLCTGNAARSVMAGAMLEAHGAGLGAAVRVTTAGTHVIEHQPMSVRTRAALRSVGLEAPTHRSRQLTEADADAADVIVAMAGEHVWYVRRRHPAAAGRTATLCYLAGRLRAGTEALAARVAELGLAELDPGDEGDVADPAGGDEAEYVACARQLSVLIAELVPRVT